jgi:hypothetical protein
LERHHKKIKKIQCLNGLPKLDGKKRSARLYSSPNNIK